MPALELRSALSHFDNISDGNAELGSLITYEALSQGEPAKVK